VPGQSCRGVAEYIHAVGWCQGTSFAVAAPMEDPLQSVRISSSASGSLGLPHAASAQRHRLEGATASQAGDRSSQDGGPAVDFVPCFHQRRCTAEVCRCARADIPCEKYYGCARLRWASADRGVPPAASTNVATTTASPDGAVAAHEGAAPTSPGNGAHKVTGSSSSTTLDDAVSANQALPHLSDGEDTEEEEDAVAAQKGFASQIDVYGSEKQYDVVEAYKGVASLIDVDSSEGEDDVVAAQKGAMSPIYVADCDEEEDAVAAHEVATSPIYVDASDAEDEPGAAHQAAPSPIDVEACDVQEEMGAAHQWVPARSDVDDTEE